MAFPDFPFRKDLPSFVSHEAVRSYLDDYADNFSLNKYIQVCKFLVQNTNLFKLLSCVFEDDSCGT